MKPKPVVCQTLYSLNIGYAYKRDTQRLLPVKVVKVGRKYFTCSPVNPILAFKRTEFHIDTWGQRTRFTPDEHLYASEQEYMDEKEQQELVTWIRNAASYGGQTRKLPLETLRQIKTLMEQPISQ